VLRREGCMRPTRVTTAMLNMAMLTMATVPYYCCILTRWRTCAILLRAPTAHTSAPW
jgi:hypothetical protein